MKRIAGPGGIECLLIEHESGASATVALHGGHPVSWKTADGIERLFLSPTSSYAKGKAIRGGVPIIFPQFSDRGPYLRHGFARRMLWAATGGDDPAWNLLHLATSPSTLAEWPYPFRLSFGLQLEADSISMNLTVENTGPAAFHFDAAFHTYLRIREGAAAAVSGLLGRAFQNEATSEFEIDGETLIRLGTEVDRTYRDAADSEVQLNDGPRCLALHSGGFPDLVVWNPGPEHRLEDLPGKGWCDFYCLEAARIESPDPLEPGATWRGFQRIVTHLGNPAF